jgi:hypothetical protein
MLLLPEALPLGVDGLSKFLNGGWNTEFVRGMFSRAMFGAMISLEYRFQ